MDGGMRSLVQTTILRVFWRRRLREPKASARITVVTSALCLATQSKATDSRRATSAGGPVQSEPHAVATNFDRLAPRASSIAVSAYPISRLCLCTLRASTPLATLTASST
ncbi:uncharacterized protein LAESUDRAFT_765615 [Laetiporus sulphureus 93-53]|uniref:Uncharacterized protein n=1 Tax=Laetiporus sulphureus 93-53 TaxID=1314785 RepID=A0A165ANX4_9APHY|nr:uncharacterized protein LAESUDRAFT_765615 [Laetiporus sulphureus 93-53]KZS99375.1 hypothetical protein LAESUDRAFT_765615 [Laetiporus sulphureus 93-53]